MPGSSHVADAVHIPEPGVGGAWCCAVALCLASLTSAMIPTHDSCHVARYRVRVILICFQQPASTSHARPRVEVPLLGLRLGLRLRLRLALPEELVRHDLAVQCAH